MSYKLQNEEGKVYGNVWREDMEGKSCNYVIILKIKVKGWLMFYNQ